VQGQNYKDGDGNEVRSTEFKSENQQLTLAGRHGVHLLSLELGWQDIPYQGFPNQYMDMTSNHSTSLNLRYKGDFDWGDLVANTYSHKVRHKMDMLSDKAELGVLTNGSPYAMPMDTRAVDRGYNLRADILASDQDVIRIGQEYHHYHIDDWWPPLAGTMMGPDTFWNINDGSRDRLAVFAEWDRKWREDLSSQLGIRYERVSMDTGNVQGYFSTGESMWGMGLSDGAVYQADANVFNARDHKKTDNNLDLTATIRYVASANASYDLGVAQKTRSPNIYERYTWSNEASMAGAMVSWFGDLNAYVGNINLKPEIARTLRATADWHAIDPQDGSLSLTPYVTHITNYIGAEVNNSTTLPAPPGRVALRFANHAADLYGLDISASKKLGAAYGIWRLAGIASYVAGKDTRNDTGLYNMMPPNIKVSLENQQNSWTHTVELKAIGAKTELDTIREELKTAGYTLLNLRTRYTMKTWQAGAGIDNVLNRHYALPLGGVDFYQYNYLSPATNGHLAQISGPGRSFNIDASVSF
jgi:iron complex outermembrane receptor protein